MENNYQLSRIYNYVNGLMSKEDMYALEREALDDPLLQEAIDGYRSQQGVDIGHLSLLQRRLADRIQAQAIHRNRRFFGWQRLAIGATAAVLFVVGCTLLLIRYLPQQAAKLTEVEIMQERVYSITLTPGDTYHGSPIGGWEYLEKYLSENYSGEHPDVEEVSVTLAIDQEGKVIDIITKNKDLGNTEELIKLLENGPKWKGDSASFHMDIHRLAIQ